MDERTKIHVGLDVHKTAFAAWCLVLRPNHSRVRTEEGGVQACIQDSVLQCTRGPDTSQLTVGP